MSARLGLAAAMVLTLLIAAPARAQIVRAFTPRFSVNENGDIALIGNTIMTCPAGGSCANGQNGAGGQVDNDNFAMTYVDVDGDGTTFSSSRAALALPAGATVVWAGLYWSGVSTNAARNVALLAGPAGGYVTVTASQLDVSGTAYQGFANVTALVQAGGNGDYAVANVRSTTGAGNFGGWGLVLVYSNPTDPPRNLVVFDGYGRMAPSVTHSIPVTGFLTPPAGLVNTRIGVIAGDGDLGQSGDAIRLNGTTLTDGMNPSNNFMNSTISRLGANVTTRNPAWLNTLGWDVDLIAANGVLANGATSATITLRPASDPYYPGAVTFATDLYEPVLTGNAFTKLVTDLTGGATVPGDALEYVVTLRNTGSDAAVNVVAQDTLPANATYVPGSIVVLTGANAGAKSDGASDDQAEYDAATRRVIVRLGTGATSALGGRLAINATTSFRFRATVNVPAPNASVVTNQALASFAGEQLGFPENTTSDADTTVAGIQRTNVTVTAPILSGTVFEDVNYGGGAGRTRAASAGVARPGARVELYGSAGAYLAAATTDAAGLYAFDGWSAGAYTVRVVIGTVTSSRPGAVPGLLPVQTFRAVASSGAAAPDPNRVGGETPALADAAANTTALAIAALTTASATAQSVAPVTLGTANLGGVDFGFNFDAVVNVNDAGHGSLRQFVINANALGNAGLAQAGQAAGIEASLFMIADGLTHPGLRAGLPNLLTAGVARITLASALPAITGASTRIDGGLQTANVGNTNPVTLGAGGVVGVDALPLPTVPGPEVELRDGGGVRIGLDLQAANLAVASIAVAGFGGAPASDLDASVRVGAAAPGASLFRCVLGTPATAFADPGAALRAGGDQVRAVGAGGGNVRECLIGFAAGTGVALTQGSNGWLIEACEVRGNAVGQGAEGGVGLEASGSATIRGCLVADHEGCGVDLGASLGSCVLENTTVLRNGRRGTDTPGVRLGGSGHLVDRCRLADNYGAGVMVFTGSATNRLTRNSMSGNGAVTTLSGGAPSGQIGIDLHGPADAPATGTPPYVSLNDAGDADAGGNDRLNFPVLQSASLGGGSLTIAGWARPGSAIELFLAAPDPAGFGEGDVYLVTLTEGSGADLDASSGAYAGAVNGLVQGADNTERFQFTVPAPAGVTGGTRLTATATLAGATSEFSGLVTVGGTVAVSGWAYDDGDHNAQRAPAEPGAGVPMWAKLVDPAAPASAAMTAAVDPLTGAYVFGFVPPGSYQIVLDDNAASADVTPSRPPDWLGTENPAGTIPVTVATVDLAGLNFGLWHGSTASGRVFRDDGAGGSVANDGLVQAAEAGVAGARVRLLASACAGGVCDSAITVASGAWLLWVPHAASSAAARIEETNLAGWISTGGVAGTTGGAYARPTDDVSFTPTSGLAYAGVELGDVPPSTWAAGGAQFLYPGQTAYYSHGFAAATAGALTVSAARLASPAIPGWNLTLVHDLDCDGTHDAGEPVIAAPLALTAGQSVCVLARHDSPAGAPEGATEQVTLTAGFSLTGAAPPLATGAALVDLTTISSAGNLQLAKNADLPSARPGDVITYTITYFNPGPEPLTQVTIHDATPAFTVFDAAACGTLGGGLAGCGLTLSPAPGTAGAVRWTLTGTLAPGGTGTVTFRVRVL